MSESLQQKRKSQMSDIERVQDFQRKLYQKAKQEKEFRFYVLYDKIRLSHFLREAYRRCKSNAGSPGVDGVTFTDIEKSGVNEFISEIQKELADRTYRPLPVLRVYIPKANGRDRPLGIPAIRDRVVQMACKLVIEPIFEAGFEKDSYGFRPKRSARDAVTEIKKNLKDGLTEVFDADLSSYFDTIPHRELLTLIGHRISDSNVLHLIKLWLKCPIIEDGKTKGGKKNKYGVPQGGVISPLLANIYLNVVDKAVNRPDGKFSEAGIKIVRYADDFVLMGRRVSKHALSYLKYILQRMKLTLNTEKSRMLNARRESFDFLGFTFRYDRSILSEHGQYWNVVPSKKSEKRVRANIKGFLKKRRHYSPELIVKGLNFITRGWMNYFMIDGVCQTYKAQRNLRNYMFVKLNRLYRRKSQRNSKFYSQGAFGKLVDSYGLIEPTRYYFERSL